MCAPRAHISFLFQPLLINIIRISHKQERFSKQNTSTVHLGKRLKDIKIFAKTFSKCKIFKFYNARYECFYVTLLSMKT